MEYRNGIDYKLTVLRRGEETTVEPVRFFARSIAWFEGAGFPEDPDWLLTFKQANGETFTVKESQVGHAEAL